MTTIRVLYFASLRDAAGIESETIDHEDDLQALYRSLSAKYDFTLPIERLRVAMNGAFVTWHEIPGEGAEVAFIPPVSGG
jgi:sulfur-carrier protein